MRLHALLDLARRDRRRLAVGQAERDAACLGLVGDVGRQDFQRHRPADLRHRGDDALGIRNGQRLGHRHTECGEEIRGAALVEA